MIELGLAFLIILLLSLIFILIDLNLGHSKKRKEDDEMRIGKDVSENFIITSEQVLELFRTGKAEINLKGEIGFTLEINDDGDYDEE